MARKLMQKSNTRKELFLNTCHHFNSENRSVSPSGGCFYRSGEKGCGIGREISDELAKELDGFCGDTIYGTSIKDSAIFKKLPKRLQKMGQKFLTKIQKLHDTPYYWDKDSLSQDGLDEAVAIAAEFNIKVTKEELINK